MRDTFHQTAIAQEAISEVINDIEFFLVKLCCQHFLSNRHADCIADALT